MKSIMSKKEHGMTLVELMVALAIGVILLTIGIPAFQTMMQGNQATGAANEMLGAIRLARSEAVKRAVPVSLCAKQDQDPTNHSCTDGDWSNGWLLFTDANGPGAFGAGEEVIRVWGAMDGAPAFNGTEPAYIRFNAQGGLHDTPHVAKVDFRFKPNGCHGSQARRIEVEKLGSSAVSVVICF
jgi:type IV fimbrial biogenesis protein FimT